MDGVIEKWGTEEEAKGGSVGGAGYEQGGNGCRLEENDGGKERLKGG